jgi:hypothetical protein
MGLCPLDSPEPGGFKNECALPGAPKKKAESPLRFVFRYVEPSHSAEQASTPSVKIKVKICVADDEQVFLLQTFAGVYILARGLCQHSFSRHTLFLDRGYSPHYDKNSLTNRVRHRSLSRM